MIVYYKAFNKLKEAGITTYQVQKEKIVSQASWQRMKNNKHVNTITIDKLCEKLECQPGDLMEYVSNK